MLTTASGVRSERGPATPPHDRIDRAAVQAVPTEELDLMGLAVCRPRNAVDKVLKGARMHM
ncbi:hypothetical protein GCM10011579_078400 [Streptomyces albiflavescens]|uniref:Uncharacterized protein n=1 Tax=Streptomyces albiflavescens TaxID=1623582 RepID=A0A917YCR1_9ACTN|nr:hypothetical protein GCM10011579_078400 [Streptomyces albiflavescens]